MSAARRIAMWLRCVTFPPQTGRRPQGCRHFSVHACALRPVSYSGRAGLPAAAAIPSRRDRMRYSIKGSAMTVTLPVPTLDHVVVNVRDRIDAGLATYRRLGFTMTPRGFHTLGSMNHLAIFGTDYLELIAAQPGETRRPEILASPFGLNGLVFGTEDSASVYSALREVGVPVEPPLQFSRPVALTGGARDATFRTVHLTPGTVPSGRVYFCHHFTRELVWRDEWRHHANGAVAVARAVIAARDPSSLGRLFTRMFGDGAVRG